MLKLMVFKLSKKHHQVSTNVYVLFLNIAVNLYIK